MALPFSGSPFVLKAVFTANTDLHIPSPVRIAGVQVGEVTGVERIKGSADAGIVMMQIDKNGLPIHADATAAIRSRIFLEGNFYVELQPGTPEAPLLELRRDASGRQHLRPGAARPRPLVAQFERPRQPPEARAGVRRVAEHATDAARRRAWIRVAGLTGAQGLNDALNYSANAFEASAIVNQALLGEQPDDLTGVVRGEAEVFKGPRGERRAAAAADRQLRRDDGGAGRHSRTI